MERHRAAMADGNLQEWREAYPAMVGAVTEAYVRRQRQGQPSGNRPASAGPGTLRRRDRRGIVSG